MLTYIIYSYYFTVNWKDCPFGPTPAKIVDAFDADAERLVTAKLFAHVMPSLDELLMLDPTKNTELFEDIVDPVGPLAPTHEEPSREVATIPRTSDIIAKTEPFHETPLKLYENSPPSGSISVYKL